jgi:feruloyl esterase
MQFIVQRNPTYPNLTFDISPAGVVGEAALKLFDERTREGNAHEASRFRDFLRKDKKLLLYHGFSDPALTPYRTMVFYEDLAKVAGGASKLERNARLFMVPGMQHCSGGPGPDVFDSVTAIDEWVVKGVAPEQMLATKFANRRSGPVQRTMPLCKFPQEAQYQGSGDVNDAANWTCAVKPSLLENGPIGRAAGWKP